MLSDYLTVPLSSYILIKVLDGRRLLTWSVRPWRWKALCSRRNVWMLLLIVVIASTGVYYAAFAMILLCVAGVVSALNARRWIPLAEVLAVVLATAGFAFANDLPGVIYHQPVKPVGHRPHRTVKRSG